MKNLKCCKLKTLAISDVHGYCRSVSTESTMLGARQVVKDGIKKGVQLIWIPGDFFDKPVSVHTVEYSHISAFIYWLLYTCKENDILLRVLEGTRSHDAGQSKMFIEINESACIGADVKYFDTLAIEHIDKLDIDVLYVPDQLNPSADKTWSQIKELLVLHGLKKVDFAITHGNYDFHVESKFTSSSHSARNYQSIVRYHVINGHIHTGSVYGKIVTVGSLARNKHDEEEDKGGLYFETNLGTESHLIERIVNRHTVIFKTIDLRGLTIEQVLEITADVMKLPIGSNFRLLYRSDDEIANSVSILINANPDFNWKTKVERIDRPMSAKLESLETKYSQTEINDKSVIDLLQQHMLDAGTELHYVNQLMTRLNTIL